jgi:hypothetical protein
MPCLWRSSRRWLRSIRPARAARERLPPFARTSACRYDRSQRDTCRSFASRNDSVRSSGGGSSATLVHLHVVALDGVFTRDAPGGAAVFHEGPAPSGEELAAFAARVAERMLRWMRRRKLLDERRAEERSNEAPDVSPLEACMQLSLFGATFLKLDKDGAKLADAEDEQRRRPRTKSPWSAEESGFNLHAGVTVRAGARAPGSAGTGPTHRRSEGPGVVRCCMSWGALGQRRSCVRCAAAAALRRFEQAKAPLNVPRRPGPAYVDADGSALLGLSAEGFYACL